MPSSLSEMAALAAIARDGSFSAAARSLGLTKQSVSDRIARLEAGLGVQLVIRSTRALRLTDAGVSYAEACAAIVAQTEAAERAVQAAQQRATGVVRISAPVGLEAMLILPVVREYRRRHPEVRVHLAAEERLVDLVREGVDLAVRAGTVAGTPSLIARPLFATECAFVASPDYLAQAGALDIARASWIATEPNPRWIVHGEPVSIRASVVVNTLAAARDAALADLGIAQVPVPLVRDDVRAGRLRAVLGAGRRIPFSVVWPARRLPLRVRAFLDVLVARGAALGEVRAAELATVK